MVITATTMPIRKKIVQEIAVFICNSLYFLKQSPMATLYSSPRYSPDLALSDSHFLPSMSDVFERHALPV